MTGSTKVLTLPLLAVLLLSGCTATTSPAPTTTAVSTSPSSAPPASTSAAPSASAPSTATPAGCAPNDVVVPTGAESAIDGDLDGDGRDDRIFYSAGENRFGISTASGAVLTVRDPLAGPGAHTGWAARIAGGATVMALADGRGARLYSLQRSGSKCALAPVQNAQGAHYTFDQEDLRGNGTGVGCREQDGALQLGGYDARPTGTGADRFRVTFTRVTVSADGRTATNGPTTTVDPSAPSGSATLRIARDSTCASVPVVGSSGR